MAARIALVDDDVFDKHVSTGGSHPERPERLHAIRRRLRAMEGVELTPVATRRASDDELLRVHSEQHLRTLDQSAGHAGYLDPDTFFSPGSTDAARSAAGAGLALFDALRAKTSDYGLALVRPPGHHARASQAMGFCLVNNAAVLAAHARAQGLDRVLVLDWDVHHGNGTEEIFYADPSVFYLSLHQYPFYPGTGAPEDIGQGDGLGRTANIALSAGADDVVYDEAFRRFVIPIVQQFAPELVIVSAGFDAHALDPLGGMELSDLAYGSMTRQLLAALPQQGRGRVALLLEGGYDLDGLAASVAATVEALHRPGAEHPLEAPNRQNLLSTRHSADFRRIQSALSRHLEV